MGTTQSIQFLLNDIERNQYFLPEFQRGFRWTPEQVKKYFRSLYFGYPTGSFLVWKCDNPPKIKSSVTTTDSKSFTRLILDGQQRLTTLYTLIKGTPPSWIEGKPPRTDLYFNLETHEFQYYTQSLMIGKKEWINICDFFRKELGDYVQNSDDSVYLMSNFKELSRLQAILKYEYYIQEIDEQNSLNVVEVFNLVNSAGTPLIQSDLILALITGRWEECKDKMRTAIKKFSSSGFVFDMDFFTRCIAVVGTDKGVFDDVKNLDKDALIEAWNKIEKSLNYLLKVLPKHGYIDDNSFLSTSYVFYTLVYYLAKNNFKFPDSTTRDKLLYWLYNALMWGRYSRSSDTTLDKDIRILKEANSVDELIKTLAASRGGNLEVTEHDLELQGVRSRFYQIVYILIQSNDAADWVDTSLPLYNKGSGRNYSVERYHIFPKRKLYKLYSSSSSYDKSIVNELANIAFSTSDTSSDTNHEIFNNDPEVYLNNIDIEQLQRQYVPTDSSLWKMNCHSYEAFLKERHRLLAQGINQFLNKLYHGESKIYVSRDITQWRQKLEEVEKAFRHIIIDVLHENEDDIDRNSYIPSHFLAKIEERIKKYFKDNPSEDRLLFQTVERKINFFDVSEYCQLIISGQNWQYFESTFGDKSALQNRFSQLQNLRNTLAHNRDLTDVVIKDGEAAILWFSSALRKYFHQEDST
jgi:hypothetical protein